MLDDVAAMRAHVVKAVDVSFLVPADQQRLLERRQLIDKEVAGVGDLIDAADHEPAALEDRFELFLINGRLVIDVRRHRSRADVRIPLGQPNRRNRGRNRNFCLLHVASPV